MKLPLSIALRFLKSSKGQTILIALGIAIGVSVQIFIGSLIQGLQKSLVDTTIGSQPQITLTSKTGDKRIVDYNKILQDITSKEDQVINLSAAADGPGLFTKNDTSFSLLIRGLNIDEADGIFKIKENIIEGNLPINDYEALIGIELQKEANLKINDEITVLTNLGNSKIFTITGVFDLGVASLNKSWTLTTLSTTQDLFSYGDEVTSINMQVKDVFQADTIAQSIQGFLPTGIESTNWKDQNKDLLSGLSGQSASSLLIQVFVMISVLLGIASILAITVVQKSRQIGILKAMGIKDKTSSLIFLFQGLLLGIIGAVLGVILGLTLAFTFTKFALKADGTPVVPLFIDPWFIAASAAIAVLASTLAALIPARKSSKLNPIEVIRNA